MRLSRRLASSKAAWVTGGPKIVKLANQAGKPSLSVGPGNAPIYIHKTADVRGAVVDILISKTFDSSVICPAEQTCIIDDEIYDEMIAEFERMGARMLSPEEAAKITEFAFGCGDKVSMDAVGQKAPELAARAGFSVPPGTKILLAPLPSDLDELAEHPLVQEKLMPVLGLVRAPDVVTRDASLAACASGRTRRNRRPPRRFRRGRRRGERRAFVRRGFTQHS